MDKGALVAAAVRQMEGELAVLAAAAQSAREEATDAESRQEGKYDMRGQTAAYLAAGQAKLASELASAIAGYRALPIEPLAEGAPANVGSVVAVDCRGKRLWYFLVPSRGGMEIAVDGAVVLALTPASPLGRQLMGLRAGDSVSVPSGRTAETGTIASIC